jgi:hypothetical protein
MAEVIKLRLDIDDEAAATAADDDNEDDDAVDKTVAAAETEAEGIKGDDG